MDDDKTCMIYCDLRPEKLSAIMPTFVLSFSFGIAAILTTTLISRVSDNFRDTQTILASSIVAFLLQIAYQCVLRLVTITTDTECALH